MINVRKILLGCLAVIVLVALGYTIWSGISIGNIEILGYKAIEQESIRLDESIEEYEQKNANGVPSKQDALEEKINEYNVQKAEYEEELNKKQTQLLSIDAADCYDVDFIWTKAGNYARDRHLDIEMNVTKNALDEAEVSYVLADLNFTVQAIIDLEGYSYDPFLDTSKFINDLEEDHKLEFEIRDLNIKKEKIKIILNQGTTSEEEKEVHVVKTTFTVYNVPLNKNTLTVLTSKDFTQLESLTQEGKGDVVNISEDGKEIVKEEDDVANTSF